MTMRTILAAVLTALSVAAPAAAQDSAWGDNGYISFNGLYDVSSRRYQTAADIEINQETTRLTATHEFTPRPVYDFSAGGRVKGNLGFGFGFTIGMPDETARITGGIPHPFFFDQPRPLDGTARLRGEDLAVHLDALWLIPATDRLQFTIFGGPTWFRLKQHTIASVVVEDEYPYDSVTLDSVGSNERKGSRVGFNVGGDASYFFSRYLGIHGLVRFSRGQISLGSGDEDRIQVGGVQAGGGLRIRF